MSYAYSTIYDAEGNFVEVVAYPNEIIEMYLSDSDFAEILAYESLADEIYQSVRVEES